MGQKQSAEIKKTPQNISEKKRDSDTSEKKSTGDISEKEQDSDGHLCFRAAFEQLSKNRITWNEYLHHCLLHYTGFRHPDDERHWYEMRDLIRPDPLGFGIWSWQHEVTGVSDVEQLEAVFRAYERASVEEVESKLSVLPPRAGSILKRSLALLAIQDRKVDMLRFVMQDRQHILDPWACSAFTDAANAVDQAKEPEVFEIINHSQWRKCNPNIPRSQLSARGD